MLVKSFGGNGHVDDDSEDDRQKIVVVIGARGVAKSIKRMADAEMTTMDNIICCPPCKRINSMGGGGDKVNEVSPSYLYASF